MTLFEQMVWSATYAETLNRFVGQADGERLVSLAIDDADEAVLRLRSFVEDEGRLHLDEGLEAERRAGLDLPEPKPEQDGHRWIKRMLGRRFYETCVHCGVTRASNDKDHKPCLGRLPEIEPQGLKRLDLVACPSCDGKGLVSGQRRAWQGWDMRSALRAFASRLRPFKMDVVEDLERLANEIGDDDPKAWREAVEAALGVEPDPEGHTPDWVFAFLTAAKAKPGGE